MNPARSVGPAVVAADGTNQWIYLIAPTLGALVTAGIFRLVTRDRTVREALFRMSR